MAKFSPMDAVFSGLRFVRSRPATLLIWSAYLLVVVTVASLALFDLGGDQLTSLAAAMQGATPDLRHVSDIMQGLLPASGFAFLLIVVFGAVLATAILRAYLELGPQSWGGLRLGGEELRLLGVGVLMLLALFMAEALVLSAAVAAAQVNIPPMAIVIVGYLLIAALAVRLSLAPVIAVVENRVSLHRSWLMTRKAFWPMLGAYLLLGVLTLVILLIVMMVIGALITAAAAVTGGGFSQLLFALQHRYEDINPLILGLYVLKNLAQVWISVVFLTMSLGVGVEAYRAYSGDV
jgi:hypothetical protein